MPGINNIIEKKLARLTVNGRGYELELKVNWTLSYVLREKLGFTGTKIACDNGACGACTVLMDGEPVLACMKLAIDCVGKHLLTIEGLSDGKTLHPIQKAWLQEHGTQCGFCAPGMILTTMALLGKDSDPTEKKVRDALSGNICRCGNYDHIVNAVMASAKKLKGKCSG